MTYDTQLEKKKEQNEKEDYKDIDIENISPLEYLFVGNATGKLIEYIIKNKDFEFSLSDIRRGGDVSMKTINRDIPKLEELGMIMHTRVIGKSKMYKVNSESPIIRHFNKLMFELATVRNYYELKKQGYIEQAEQLIEGSKYFPSS
jgi:predicted transcriptional regulator